MLAGLIGFSLWTILDRASLRDAELAMAKGDHQNAIRHALDDLRIWRWSRASSLIAARSFSLERYPDEAEPLYRNAERFGSLPIEAQYDRIQGLVRTSRNDQAVTLCRDLLKSHPDDPTVLRLLATVEWSQGRLPLARDAAERLTQTAEGQVDGFDLLASIERDAERREQAVAACEALLSIDPELKRYRPVPRAKTIPAFWASFAEDLLVIKRPTEAKEHILKQITAFSDPLFHDLLGSAELDLENPREAEAAWRESIRRDPKRLNPWLRIGNLMLAEKRYAEAVEALEKAVAIAPELEYANSQLGRAYQFVGRDADAKRVLQRAKQLKRVAPVQPGAMRPAS